MANSYIIKFNGGRGAFLCKECNKIIHYGFEVKEEDEVLAHYKTHDNTDPIQDNCKYGYVLPDRCRYSSRTGCDCGAYPPIKINEEKENTPQQV